MELQNWNMSQMDNIITNISSRFRNLNDSSNYTSLNHDNITTAASAVDRLVINNSNQIFYIFLGIFGFVSNIYVIIIIATYKPMRKNLANVYMANQSILDATSSIFLLLTTIYQDNGTGGLSPKSLSDKLLCGFWYTKMPVWGALDSSSYNIVALTFDRYIAIVHPIWYKTKLSQNKFIVGLSLALIWLIGPVYNSSYMLPTAGITDSGFCAIYSEYSSELAQTAQGVFDFFFEFFIPATLIVIGYAMIGASLHGRVKRTAAHALSEMHESIAGAAGILGDGVALNQEAVLEQHERRESGMGHLPTTLVAKPKKEKTTMTRARRNVLITSATIAMFFIFSWSWGECYYLAYNLSSTCCSLSSEFNTIASGLVYINCCANPIIYSLTYTEFKRGAVNLLTRIKKSTTVGDTSITASSR